MTPNAAFVKKHTISYPSFPQAMRGESTLIHFLIHYTQIKFRFKETADRTFISVDLPIEDSKIRKIIRSHIDSP